MTREQWLKKVDEMAERRAREVVEAKENAIAKWQAGDLAAGVFLHELYPEEFPTDPRAAVGVLSRRAPPPRPFNETDREEES